MGSMDGHGSGVSLPYGPFCCIGTFCFMKVAFSPPITTVPNALLSLQLTSFDDAFDCD